MKISPIAFSNRLILPQNKTNLSFRGLDSDVFIKSSDNLKNKKNSEYDQSFNSFLNWIDNTYGDLKDKNFKGKLIGSGFEGVVYQMNGTDNWVMKESKRSAFIPGAVDKMEIIEITDEFPTLNIGQPIAKVTLPKAAQFSYTFYVLKKQRGKSLGVAPDEFKEINTNNLQRHLNSLKVLASAPQSTYEKLIQDVTEISEKGYEIDCGNPNNILFNVANQSINFVDINKFDVSNNKNSTKNSQLGNVLYALLDTEFEKVLRENPTDDETIQLRKKYISQICEKYFYAMKQQGAVFHLEYFFTILLNSSILDDILNAKTELDKVETLIKNGLM